MGEEYIVYVFLMWGICGHKNLKETKIMSVKSLHTLHQSIRLYKSIASEVKLP